MTKTYCCYGAYADVGCVADCPARLAKAERAVWDGFKRIDAMIADFQGQTQPDPELLALAAQALDSISWRAYERAWPTAMCGYEFTRDKSYSFRRMGR